MGNKVLVAYASTHGSTEEISETVAATIRERGLAVDLRPARNVRTLEGYQAVVLGAPIYLFHLHKDALRFLSNYEKEFTGGLPVAIFAGGPIETDKDQWEEIRRQLAQELAKFPWLRPIAVEVVGGRFNPEKLHLPYNLIPALKKMPPTDLRDWEAIRRWAGALAAEFQPAIS
jgi:menaquinone-dependent protoporphyrinogen oxidase